jgi:hypothetical protein
VALLRQTLKEIKGTKEIKETLDLLGRMVRMAPTEKMASMDIHQSKE